MMKQGKKVQPVSTQMETKIVRSYLEGLVERQRPTGRRTVDYLQRRLGEIEAAVGEASAFDRLLLTQERFDIEAELADRNHVNQHADAEEAFVQVAAKFSERKGLSYRAWRAVGVPAGVLRRAGVA